MADENKKAVTKSELDSEISAINTNYYSIANNVNKNTTNIITLQNQMNELSVFESGSTNNFYLSVASSTILTNKGTLKSRIYKIGKLLYFEFSYLVGSNTSISSGVTLSSKYIEPQDKFVSVSLSETKNNVTYKIGSMYDSSTQKYKYYISITTTASSATLSNVTLKDFNLLT